MSDLLKRVGKLTESFIRPLSCNYCVRDILYSQKATSLLVESCGLIQKLQKENEDLKERNLNLEDSYKNVIKVNNEYVIRNSNLRKENDELKAELEKEKENIEDMKDITHALISLAESLED